MYDAPGRALFGRVSALHVPDGRHVATEGEELVVGRRRLSNRRTHLVRVRVWVLVKFRVRVRGKVRVIGSARTSSSTSIGSRRRAAAPE